MIRQESRCTSTGEAQVRKVHRRISNLELAAADPEYDSHIVNRSYEMGNSWGSTDVNATILIRLKEGTVAVVHNGIMKKLCRNGSNGFQRDGIRFVSERVRKSACPSDRHLLLDGDLTDEVFRAGGLCEGAPRAIGVVCSHEPD